MSDTAQPTIRKIVDLTPEELASVHVYRTSMALSPAVIEEDLTRIRSNHNVGSGDRLARIYHLHQGSVEDLPAMWRQDCTDGCILVQWDDKD